MKEEGEGKWSLVFGPWSGRKRCKGEEEERKAEGAKVQRVRPFDRLRAGEGERKEEG